MEISLTLDVKVSVDKTVRGFGDTSLDSMFIWHRVFSIAIRQLRTVIDVFDAVSNLYDASNVYYPIIKGTRLRSSAVGSIQMNFDARMLEILTMRSACYFICLVVTVDVCQW